MLTLGLFYQDLDPALSAFVAWTERLADLRPLADRLAALAVEQNAIERGIGHDQYDVPFWRLADSTMQKRERQGRLGPPLAPDDLASPIVTGFRAEPEVAAPDDITIRCHWPGVPWVGFHTDNRDARFHLPVRDPAGMPAWAQQQAAVAFEQFVAGLTAA